ncbi:hypothetical protein BDN70DRAFT_92645 [Pholiota conissans]|uniref:F-box domain-containing protein n=1 Tax=Pholiota conissans TaxID=109636 RepID=A0A9P5YXX2_9AGAR|nr:hypothetical protein BDN70DRAFT_92645 [Pholiota conissans]
MDARQVSGDQNIATEDQYQQIDEEISRLYASIAALKSRRNALSPLYRLPPEIITTIFLCVKRAYRRSNFLDHFSPFKWISLTHVSSHLRSIAINAPCLWVDPPLDNLPWMEEMLKRSKNAGLIVNARLSSKGNPPGLEQVLQHSAHIKVLRFDILSPDHYTQMLQYLPRSAPQLAYLAINAPYFGPGHFQTIQPFFVSIPSNILLETPRLRYLELTSCKFNWNTHSHLFHSLAHLRIYYLPQTSRPTPKQMVDVLKAMPNIISLCLSHALPTEANNRVSWTSGPIHLASLRRLEIQDTTTGLEDFFSCVTFPLTATMQALLDLIQTTSSIFKKS